MSLRTAVAVHERRGVLKGRSYFERSRADRSSSKGYGTAVSWCSAVQEAVAGLYADLELEAAAVPIAEAMLSPDSLLANCLYVAAGKREGRCTAVEVEDAASWAASGRCMCSSGQTNGFDRYVRGWRECSKRDRVGAALPGPPVASVVLAYV